MDNNNLNEFDNLISEGFPRYKRLSNEQKQRLLDTIHIQNGSSGFLKIAVVTLLLLFTFNLISARQYYRSRKISTEQSIYTIYFEPINE